MPGVQRLLINLDGWTTASDAFFSNRPDACK